MKKFQKNEGFTLIELLIVVAIIGIIAAIAVPGLLRARMAGNESSAIGSMRAIVGGQASFASSCGNGFYADTLENLAEGPGGADGFIGADLGVTDAVKSGYTISLEAGDPVTGAPASCNGMAADTVVQSYYASATPVSTSTGTRAFATSQAGTIWQDNESGVAPPEPFTAGGAISPIQ